MQTFDKALWKKRAAERRTRALEKGLDPDVVNKKFKRDQKYIGFLETAIKWCSDHKISVVFNRVEAGWYFPDNATVTISGRLAPENQVYVLLHELGHHLVARYPNEDKYAPLSALAPDGQVPTGTHQALVTEVGEEYEAWKRGIELASELNIVVDNDNISKFMTECLVTHIRETGKALRKRSNKSVDKDD